MHTVVSLAQHCCPQRWPGAAAWCHDCMAVVCGLTVQSLNKDVHLFALTLPFTNFIS